MQYTILCVFQLLDLRQVIARMLGLDVNSLAVPDFEIISRLEKLVEAQREMALELRPTAAGRGYLGEAQRRMKMRTEPGVSGNRRWK